MEFNIVYGFNNKEIRDSLSDLLKNKGYEVKSYVYKTKLGLYYRILNDPEVNCVILTESNSVEGDWSAYEIAKLTDYRDVNVIALLNERHCGTEYMKILYSSGVTSAIVGNVSIEDIARLVEHPRTRRDAVEYYKIEKSEKNTGPYFNLKTVTGSQLEQILNYFAKADSDSEFIDFFDNVCCELNKSQIEDLQRKINSNQRELIKKSRTWKIVFGKNQPSGVKEKVAYPNLRKQEIYALYAFGNDRLQEYLNDTLREEQYIINSISEVTKSGVLSRVRENQKINTIVTIEHLERRGPYLSEELKELVGDRNVNIVINIDSERKGTEYVEQIYAEGITSALIGAPRTEDIIDLMKQPRSRYDARAYYGISLGFDEHFILSPKYMENMKHFLERESMGLLKKYEFIQGYLNKRQLAVVLGTCNESTREKLDELLGKKKKVKSGDGNVSEKKLKSDLKGSFPTFVKENVEKIKNIFSNKKKRYLLYAIFLTCIVIIVLVWIVSARDPELQPETVYNQPNVIVQGNDGGDVQLDETVESTEKFVLEALESTVDYTTAQETITTEPAAQQESTSALKKVKETVPEPTIAKIPKKKKEVAKNDNIEEEITNKPRETVPSKRSIGNRSESNVLSSGKISSIRSSVMSSIGGSRSDELMNLAKYMSANRLSNASSVYKELTNEQKSLSSKTCTIDIDSDSQDDIMYAASKAADKLGGISGTYGIGVSSTRRKVGYSIYIVVVY